MEKPLAITNESNLFKEIRSELAKARTTAMRAVNSTMVTAYWNVGRLIMEAQGGAERSEYGDGLIKRISKQLTAEFGKGFTVTNLKYMRQFYLTFPKGQTVSDQLTWSHYCLLIAVQNATARDFYIEETIKGQWSVRQLKRQINTFFYERLLASQDKQAVAAELKSKDPEDFNPRELIRDPYVLEFLDLKAPTSFYEKDVEQGLINHLEEFLLEMGRGFAFIGRQKRITFDGRHFYIDLVFYNIVAKCFCLIDLKLGDLTHQDIGQMQMYVNYFNENMRTEGDNPTIGLLLCADKSDEIIRYTLGDSSANILAAKYLPYMPTEEELRRELRREYDNIVSRKQIEKQQ